MKREIKVSIFKPLWKIIVISLILFLWNVAEKRYLCTEYQCFFCKKENDVFLLLHILYHNIEKTSLVNAASFFSLFALVIALIQAIYPYRLGEVYGYPIGRLKKTFDRQLEIQKLIYCVFTAVMAEIFQLYILDAGMVFVGYIIIGKWIYQIVKWYKNFENKKSEFLNQFAINLRKILTMEGKKLKEEKDIRELIERLAKSGGVEEREILEEMAVLLYSCKNILNELQYQKIFELSFFMAESIMENCSVKGYLENAWHFKMLKESIQKSSCQMGRNWSCAVTMRAEEAFILGVFCGCLAENDIKISKWCIYDVFIEFQKQVNQLQAAEMTAMLSVFLELYCDINETVINSIDMMIEGNNFNTEKRDLMQLAEVKNKMTQIYHILLRLNYIDEITEYDLVEVLHKELVGIQDTMPKTIFGLMSVFAEK